MCKINSIDDINFLLNQIFYSNPSTGFLKKRIKNDLDSLQDDKNHCQIIFLKNQIENLQVFSKTRRFSNECYIICLKMFLFSPKMYNLLRDFNILCLPHPRSLSTLVSDLNVSSDNENENFSYLQKKNEIFFCRSTYFCSHD